MELCLQKISALQPKDVALDGYTEDPTFHAAGLFDLKEEKVLYADRIHDRLYPASTTKLMTAYLALKYGNRMMSSRLERTQHHLHRTNRYADFRPGDQLTLGDLLAGLMLYSAMTVPPRSPNTFPDPWRNLRS